MHIRSIVEKYIGPKEAEEFANWAFGEGFEYFFPLDFLTAWNKNHGEKLTIKEDGDPYMDIPKMINIWHFATMK